MDNETTATAGEAAATDITATHCGARSVVTKLPESGPIPCPDPDCGGEVREADVAVRWNRLRVEDGKVYATCGDGDWAADDPRWVCDRTGWAVLFDFDIQVEDYS